MLAEKQLGRISSRLGTGRASYSQPSTPKGTIRPCVVEPPPWCLMATTRVIFALPQSPGFERGNFCRDCEPLQPCHADWGCCQEVETKAPKRVTKATKATKRSWPLQSGIAHATCQPRPVARATPSLFSGEGGRTGEIGVVSTHADAWPSPVTPMLTGEPGQVQEESRLPKAALERGQEQGEVVNGRTPLGCCDQCVNSTEVLSGISLCSRDAMFLCLVSSTAEFSIVFSETRRAWHAL